MDEMLGLRAQKKLTTRRKILKSAATLFRQKGFTAATLEEVAARAGVTKQTVLRYFTSKEQIALEFRQVALHNFRKGLLDPARTQPVLAYWRDFIQASATEVARRGDIVRYSRLVDSEPALTAASLKIQMEYEALLAAEFSREARRHPADDVYARLLASFLAGGNFAVARMLRESDSIGRYVETALAVVDFAIHKFPSRAEFERFEAASPRAASSHRSLRKLALKTVTG